ncbi:MAG TPA: hypothetical protein VMT81_01220 [Candidatus Paceibacterota bacterium]|nr:hypothetical protein [Candidatus Paceibacterota bacterium]
MTSQILQALSFVGIAVTVGWLVSIGRKLEILDNLQETTAKIKHNVKVVSDFLIKNAANFNHTELQNYSPIRLTEDGERFIATLGFDKIFTENQKDFFDCIAHDAPVLKYDVETAAIKSIHILSEKPYMNFLKVYLYNNPSRSLDNVAPTLGIYVRDRYLAEHPEIKE